MVGAVRLTTVGVSDMHIALGLFRDVMRLRVERRGPVPRALLKAWHLPSSATAHMVELSSKGHPVGRLRLVEFDPPPKQRVRADLGGPDAATDVGPKSIDVAVADPILPSVRKIESAGFQFRSRPVRVQASEACQFAGSDGVLIQLGVGTPGAPFSEVKSVTIVAADLARTRGFYEGVLGLVAVSDADVAESARDAMNDLTGASRGARSHIVTYARPGEASGKISCVHFFEHTGKRLSGRMRPGYLGLSLLTLDTDDINALYTRLRAVGAEVVTPPTQIDGDGAPYRVMLARGPNEEMFEFVQAGAGPVARAKTKPKAKKPVKKAKPKAKPKAKAKARPKPKAKNRRR